MSSARVPFDVKSVKGNAPDHIKEFVHYIFPMWSLSTHTGSQGFADAVASRMRLTEVSINAKEDAPKKIQATVVCELDVEEDMSNGAGNMHGGCSAYLIDVCTSLPLAVVLESEPGVSQAINMIYHAPAPVGTPLRIICTSIAVGGRMRTARGEIWDIKNGRLVASGTQSKVLPSEPKL